MDVKLVITEDGSHSLFVPGLDEHYHSIHGAISESQHIFIDAGLKYSLKEKTSVNILEIGFGTGLNAILTLLELSKPAYRQGRHNVQCEYTAIETFPLEKETYSLLNYPEILCMKNDSFLIMHDSPWNKKTTISSLFVLQKILGKAQEIMLPENYFDVVYFDAFAPNVQPEMWTKNIFFSIYRSMKTAAVLTSYSTKGDVKRVLKEIGFTIEKLAGPKGKREILRAVKIRDDGCLPTLKPT
ncbi:MAG: tRNA (5-methylaminomethyl-2-thiouridine)(34)-methyltransferase MnmD [Bacteroidales bacterium]